MKKSSLKNYITLLEAAADSATYARDYWMREHERRVEELLEADNKIAELKRRLDDNGGLCTLRAKLTTETCEETLARLLEDNERLRRHFSDCTEHNHSFERDHNDTQA